MEINDFTLSIFQLILLGFQLLSILLSFLLSFSLVLLSLGITLNRSSRFKRFLGSCIKILDNLLFLLDLSIQLLFGCWISGLLQLVLEISNLFTGSIFGFVEVIEFLILSSELSIEFSFFFQCFFSLTLFSDFGCDLSESCLSRVQIHLGQSFFDLVITNLGFVSGCFDLFIILCDSIGQLCLLFGKVLLLLVQSFKADSGILSHDVSLKSTSLNSKDLFFLLNLCLSFCNFCFEFFVINLECSLFFFISDTTKLSCHKIKEVLVLT